MEVAVPQLHSGFVAAHLADWLRQAVVANARAEATLCSGKLYFISSTITTCTALRRVHDAFPVWMKISCRLCQTSAAIEVAFFFSLTPGFMSLTAAGCRNQPDVLTSLKDCCFVTQQNIRFSLYTWVTRCQRQLFRREKMPPSVPGFIEVADLASSKPSLIGLRFSAG